MEFSIKAVEAVPASYELLLATKTDCLVFGVFEDGMDDLLLNKIDQVSNGLIKRLIKNSEISGKKKTHIILHEVLGLSANRILLFGLGKKDKFDTDAWTTCMEYTIDKLLPTQAKSALWIISEPCATINTNPSKADELNTKVQANDFLWALRVAIQKIGSASYDLLARHGYLQAKPHVEHTQLKKIVFGCSKKNLKAAQIIITEATALVNGMNLARDLANLPANICTPTYLAKQASKIAKDYQLKIEILEEKQLLSLKMGAFLAVAKGSTEPPKFIVLHYQGAKTSQAPIVLIGKGITFDSGGISLKPGDAMDEMKFDMCGAASVLGTVLAAAQLKLKQNIVVLIPSCENMPAGNAVKPGDVIVSMSGQTIEVLNTDAEGRLILSDALSYAERFKPCAVIDVATLTGACVIALGEVNSGLYSNDDLLAQQIIHAGKQTQDLAWRMPLEKAYQKQLKSNFADMANIGGRPAGSITAACFLARFTKKYCWAHLDIAGTAWLSGKNKGATARPVPMLLQFLIERTVEL